MHRSWQTRTALLAWSVLNFCFRRSAVCHWLCFRTKRCSRPLHLTISRTKSVANCRKFRRRSLAFSSVRPPVNCACVPQLFEQLVNSMLCPAFLKKFVCQPLRCVPFQILYKLCIKILCSSLNMMLIVDKQCSDASAVTNFRCHKLNSDMENFICNAVRRKIHYFKHQKYQNLWMNNKSRGD